MNDNISRNAAWIRVSVEAEDMHKHEPTLAGLVSSAILNHKTLKEAVCYRLAQLLANSYVSHDALLGMFKRVTGMAPELEDYFAGDLMVVLDRDPACQRIIEPLLFFKGFHALQVHRIAHFLWHNNRKNFALYLQSQCSRIFSIDIHPAASFGHGIFIDHGHAIVVGETAVVGNNVSILQDVTLGGTGKEVGDRHPKVGDSVLIGAGAKVLGNINIGNCVRIGAGSLVLEDVEANTTVAGVPAKPVGYMKCDEPGRAMDQMLD
jgi:serine O-acetyltransferase